MDLLWIYWLLVVFLFGLLGYLVIWVRGFEVSWVYSAEECYAGGGGRRRKEEEDGGGSRSLRKSKGDSGMGGASGEEAEESFICGQIDLVIENDWISSFYLYVYICIFFFF